MSLPVNGSISSKFGNRIHPISGVVKFHNGIDIRCSIGTPVKTMYGGKVKNTGNDSNGYGLYLAMTNKNGSDTVDEFFGHLSSYNVPDRNKIYSPGEVIAYSGNTGNSTGPHLHYEIRVNGSAVDPIAYLGKNPKLVDSINNENTTESSNEILNTITQFMAKGFLYIVLIAFIIFAIYKIY